MGFKDDVARTEGLADAWKPGLRALTTANAAKVTVAHPGKLAGSVNVDGSLLQRFPNSKRWDYVVGWRVTAQEEILHWIEVHPASGTRTIGELGAKLSWLKGWLDGEGKMLKHYGRKFVWIASGGVAFRAGSPQSKKISSMGILLAGHHYIIKD